MPRKPKAAASTEKAAPKEETKAPAKPKWQKITKKVLEETPARAKCKVKVIGNAAEEGSEELKEQVYMRGEKIFNSKGVDITKDCREILIEEED